jgi:hypothetical protein
MVLKYWKPAYDELCSIFDYYPSLSCNFALVPLSIPKNNGKAKIENNEKTKFQLLHILRTVSKVNILRTHLF